MLKEVLQNNNSNIIYDSGLLSAIGNGITMVLYQSEIATTSSCANIYIY